MFLEEQEPDMPPRLLDSARGLLTIGGPSDFYTSFFFYTNNGAKAHLIYRMACDSYSFGQDCATNCQMQPDHPACLGQPGGELEDWTTVSSQALHYFGSPLARCPLRNPVPGTPTPPGDDVKPTTTLTTEVNTTPSTVKTPSILSSYGTTTEAATPTTSPIKTTKSVTTSTIPDTVPTSASSTNEQALTSTLKTPNITANSTVQETPRNTTSIPIASSTTPVTPTSSAVQPTLTTPSQVSDTSIPDVPASLPVVQFTSTAPSQDSITSKASILIPVSPRTTAFAQTSDSPMKYWAAIVGGVVGGLAVLALLGYVIYRSRQRTLQKRQEIYTVTPQSISSIEENGTSGRSDVPMTTALL
ncbi:delta-like protein d [Plakobranchus ocellatus]|uniref:Delta-like protein d n=1 Tax=Plakobranchus ocellatus TaxID=259542 RepID=A0AAV4C335_9GAST|nr:delta-like protein d [Plakobranchus ocellatus]